MVTRSILIPLISSPIPSRPHFFLLCRGRPIRPAEPSQDIPWSSTSFGDTNMLICVCWWCEPWCRALFPDRNRACQAIKRIQKPIQLNIKSTFSVSLSFSRISRKTATAQRRLLFFFATPLRHRVDRRKSYSNDSFPRRSAREIKLSRRRSTPCVFPSPPGSLFTRQFPFRESGRRYQAGTVASAE